MTKETASHPHCFLIPFLLLGLSVAVGCAPQASGETAAFSLPESQACQLALLPPGGSGDLDGQIRKAQESIATTPRPLRRLERLGWLFVSKARTAYDPGFYTQAQACAQCLQQAADAPEHPPAMLLRGHVLHSLHQFPEAEEVARRLVEVRGLPYDFGLLGDVLQEQGKIEEAARAYQRMLDLKPGPKAYMRAAHVRWLKGDLEGAVELMTAAAAAGNRDSEAAAWAFSRLAWYQLQAGRIRASLNAVESAEQLHPGYAPALLMRGRIHLAQGDPQAALPALQEAARLNPLPEYLWVLADTLRLLGRDGQARELEVELSEKGPADDPRTAALFLATRQSRSPDEALRLARRELELRQDVFTHDALAWALHSAGRFREARDAMQKALALDTPDARLYLHAGLISTRAGDHQEASRFLARAENMRQTLLPSEAALLDSAPSPQHP
ncbi:MAG TPA: tetratricopeptide repeat protein [Acidobacteriota bacterium]|nr:tetratricopeptide repeat protein [Acidobacteriota bacterium]